MARQRRPPQNPILASIEAWLSSLPTDSSSTNPDHAELLASAPKRFTTYEPMVLLPTGSFTAAPWVQLLNDLREETKSRLWSTILEQISGKAKATLTHLATNEGIPLHEGGKEGEENVLRSPCGLKLLYGDFGPEILATNPNWQEEFERAFWVSTKQNGIVQTWAPRWTMFSRGNVKEKARLMTFPAVSDRTTEQWAVDLYAGIGYFVFSYAKLGWRVLCWEINPWSIEGLRRGALANGWTVRVVAGEDLAIPLEDLIAGGQQIIVLSESNEKALGRLEGMSQALTIGHVNCGFLPTSRPVWEAAWKMTSKSHESWLHLHDNVGTKEVEGRTEEIQEMYDDWAQTDPTCHRVPVVEHVEYVKTYAPDVWHCVFDVHVTHLDSPLLTHEQQIYTVIE
ncbi:hypothetical protein NLU13_4199 [Sarocladium strictum]|uniref:tRNA wybutosine-synthesizing protein 2 n=1 Tax=Sarocladium strictum TaxID=5046 RepID=A0AA39GIF1_SARSR|nr:hypothetical protein NLU13_4199 [Sarocladium strictum]